MNEGVSPQAGQQAAYQSTGVVTLESEMTVLLSFIGGQCQLRLGGKTEACPPGMRFVRTKSKVRYLATPRGWEVYNDCFPHALDRGCQTLF